jgi:L-threonylcarbamoyladenylate synthase
MLGCILDAGPCDVGVESTVVDGTQWSTHRTATRVLKVLRPGGVGVEQIEKVVAAVDDNLGFSGTDRTTVWVYGRDPPMDSSPATTTTPVIHSPRPQTTASSITRQPEIHNPSTPGMKYKHYSPSIPVYLLYPTNTFPANPLQHSDAAKPDKPEEVWKHIADQLVAVRADSTTADPQSRRSLRFGLMAFDDSALLSALANDGNTITCKHGKDTVEIRTEFKSLGQTEEDAARALFRDMLAFEGSPSDARQVEVGNPAPSSEPTSSQSRSHAQSAIASSSGVDAIIIEACSETGVGLAVMERVNKAVGGGGTGEGLGIRGTSGQQKRFWVDASRKL